MKKGAKRFDDLDELAKSAGLKDKNKLAKFLETNEGILSLIVPDLLEEAPKENAQAYHAIPGAPPFLPSNRQLNSETILDEINALKLVSPENTPEKAPATAPVVNVATNTRKKLF